MSQKTRTYEAREKRKCRAKTKYYDEREAKEMVDHMRFYHNKEMEIYTCPWCHKLHLTTTTGSDNQS